MASFTEWKRIAVAGTAALLLTAAAPQDRALAADPVDDIVQSYNWTGLYVGGHAGYGFGDADSECDAFPAAFWCTGPAVDADFDPEGFLGGGQLGYLYQTGNFVFGGDVSASVADIDDDITSPWFPGTDTHDVSVDLLLLVQGRVGWAQDNWLMFLQGGYAGANISYDVVDCCTGGGVQDSEENWHNGFTVGAGLLYSFAPGLSFGAEYNYVMLESEDNSFSDPVFFGGTDVLGLDAELHVIKATFNIHLGQFGPTFGAGY